MSLWSQISELPDSSRHELYQAYKNHFPEQIQCFIAHSFDQKSWSELFDNNQTNYEKPNQFIAKAIKEIDTHLNKHCDKFCQFVATEELKQSMKYVQANYLNDPSVLIGLIQNYTNVVRTTINTHRANIQQGQLNSQSDLAELCQLVKEAQAMSTFSKVIYQQLQELQQRFLENHAMYQRQNNKSGINGLQNEFFNVKSKLLQDIIEKYKMTGSKLQFTPALFEKVINKWRRAYQLSLIGYQFHNNLDQIQGQFESAVEILLSCKSEIAVILELNRSIQMGIDNQSMALDQVGIEMGKILALLLKMSFVIEEQPLFFKKDATFKLSGRFLFGKKLSEFALLADIRVKLVAAKQAIQISKSGSCPKMNSTSSTEPIILNSTANLNYSSASSKIELASMQLHRFNRKPEESQHVVEKKYFLLVLGQINFNFHQGPVEFTCLSFPLSILTHTNQVTAAWAVITWSYAFQHQDELQSIPFRVVGKVLSDKFQSTFGRELTIDNLRFIASKLSPNPLTANWQDELVHWATFARDGGNRRTFWDWFYNAFELTKTFLSQLWADGLIMGFVSKKDSENMLSNSPPGTFILRYSESDYGGISVAWYDDNKGQLMNLKPFKQDNLKDKCLADHLRDLDHLSYIYLDKNNIVTKDEVFEKHYVGPSEPTGSGHYVKPVSKTIVPGYTNRNSTPRGSITGSFSSVASPGSAVGSLNGLTRQTSGLSIGTDIDIDSFLDNSHQDNSGLAQLDIDFEF